MLKLFRILAFFFALHAALPANSQIFPIPGGPVIPGNGPTCFNFNVSGVGIIYPPGWGWYSPYIDFVTISSIITTHPQTLVITLVSPAGTSITLSAYNGAGGSNYINTTFSNSGWQNITTSNAPFTGTYYPQGPGDFSAFDFQNADGTWQLCIEDTLQDTLTSSLPGPYGNSFGGGTIGFGASPGPPPCNWTMFVSDITVNACAGSSYDLNFAFSIWPMNSVWTLNGNPVSNPTAVTQSGVYHVVMDDGFGCIAFADVTLNFLAPATLGADQTITVCNSTGINLNTLYSTSGYYSYWSFAGGALPPGAPTNTTVAGDYTLIATSVTNDPGCSDTAVVTIANAGTVFTPQVQNICNGGAYDLTTAFVTTGLNVTWSFNGNPVSNPSGVTAPGVYTMQATNSTGCTSIGTVTLNLNGGPSLGADLTGSVCAGSTVDLTTQFPSGTAATAWTYNGNPFGTPAAAFQSGTYSLIATDAGGCSDTADYFLTNNPLPALGANQNVAACAGMQVDLTTVFNLSGLNAVWTYGAGVPVANPAAVTLSGSYDVTVTDVNGCTDFAQVMVAYSQAVILGSNQWVDICSDTTFDLTSAYSTGGWNTQWQLNGANVPNPTSVNTAGVYTIIATNPGGCSGTAQLTLGVLPAPLITSSQTVTICGGNTTDLTALYSTTGLNTSWTYNSLPATPPVSVGGWGYYEITVTNPAGCTASSTVFLDLLPKPGLGNDQSYIYCSNNPADLNSHFVLTGLNVVWTESGNLITNTIVSTSGAYQVIATNSDGCSDTAMLNLQYDPAPSLGVDQTVMLCDGQTIDLNSLYNTTGMTIAWTLNSAPVSNPSAVNATGNYVIFATNGSNCSDDATVQITVNPPLDPGANQDLTLCSWMTVDLNSLFNLAGLTAAWQLNGVTLSNVSAINDSGTYLLAASDVNGCSATAQVVIHDGACRCEADYKTDAACTEFPSTFKIISDSAVVAAHWDFGGLAEDSYEISPSLKLAPNTDSVTVTLIAELTCGIDTVMHAVMVRECAEACHLYFPSAFSPNEDGLNDHFTPVSDCSPEGYSLEIYNRFGQVVFSSKSLTKGWDGKYQQDSVDDVYVYKVKYQFPYQKEKTESGRFSIIH